MNDFLTYQFESTLCIVMFYTIYWFFLRRDTFFNVNRFYLLSMVLFSLLLPLLPVKWIDTGSPSGFMVLLEPVIITPDKVQQTLMNHLQWIEIAAVVYFTGVFIFLIRFALQIFQLYRITKRFGVCNHDGHRVVFVDRGYAPFSFFNLVFINEKEMTAESMTAILEHERVHIRQHHTLDMILVELAAAVQWFNPLIWLAGREMKSIHEYLADEAVLQNGISRSKYQQMILDETMGIRVNGLTNNFNVSLLKKRIVMMTKQKSNNWAKGKVLIALPVLLVLVFVLTARSFTRAVELTPSVYPGISPALLTTVPNPIIQDKPKNTTEIKYVDPKTGKEVYTVVDKLPEFRGGKDGYVKFLLENIIYPEDAKKKGITGTVFITFVVEADGAVTGVKVLRGFNTDCDKEALRVVKMMPNWIPGENKGKKVAVQYNLPIKFALDGKKKEEPKK